MYSADVYTSDEENNDDYFNEYGSEEDYNDEQDYEHSDDEFLFQHDDLYYNSTHTSQKQSFETMVKYRTQSMKHHMPVHIVDMLNTASFSNFTIQEYHRDTLIAYFLPTGNTKPVLFTWFHIWKDEHTISHCVSYTSITLLHWAILCGSVTIVNHILKQYPTISRTLKDPYGRTGLHIACMLGYLPIVKLLVTDHKKNIHTKTVSYATPLHKAVDNGHMDVFSYLVSKGANVTEMCEILEHPTGIEFPIAFNVDLLGLLEKDPTDLPYVNWEGRKQILQYVMTHPPM